MRILVNGYNLRQVSTGIANVIINAVNACSEIQNVSIELVVSPIISDEIKNRISNKVKITVIGDNKSLKWLMISFPRYVKKTVSDLIWSPTPLIPGSIFRRKIPVLVTINDFVSIEYRNTMTFKGRLITRLLEKKTITKSNYLWCISNYTKSKLDEYYPKRKAKKVFVGCAPDCNIKRIEFDKNAMKAFLESFNIKKDFILFVGSLEPRKNLAFLLQLFREFHKTHDMELVIVGARNWGKTRISDIINDVDFPKEDVIFTRFVSELELMSLYSLAKCYISTSLNEGFGLPQAEAMLCGCPVVTAHNSAMIEVVENAGITVKGWNIIDWKKNIEYVLEHRSEIIMNQTKRSELFNWPLIAKNLYEYLQENKNN